MSMFSELMKEAENNFVTYCITHSIDLGLDSEENGDDHTQDAEQTDHDITSGISKAESESQAVSTEPLENASPNDETLSSINDIHDEENTLELESSKDPTDEKKVVTADISKESTVQENSLHENDETPKAENSACPAISKQSDSRASTFRLRMPLVLPSSSLLFDLDDSDDEGSPVQGCSKRARMEGEDNESARTVDDLTIKELIANALHKLQVTSSLLALLNVNLKKLTRSRNKHRTRAKKSADALKVVQDKNKGLQLSIENQAKRIEELDVKIKAKEQELADREETDQRDCMMYCNNVAVRTWVLSLIRLKVDKDDPSWLPTSVPWAYPDDHHDIDLFEVERSLVKEIKEAQIAANASAQAQHD